MSDELEFKSPEYIKGFVAGTRGAPFKVTFQKSDGTLRNMKCRLDLDFKPKKLKEGEVRKKVPKDSCFVYDIKKKEHRSFKADKVTFIK